MNSKTIETLEELKQLSHELTQKLKIPQLVLLKGELAIGKTQLVKYMVSALKRDSKAVHSPTFSLINTYSSKKSFDIHHIDLYRLKSDEELKEIGFWGLFYKESLIFIEWPEKIEKELPPVWNKLWIEGSFSQNKQKRIFQWQNEKTITR